MFIALAALALSAPVPKATAPDLKWKFTKGDTVYVTATMESSSTVKGNVAAQNNLSTVEYVYKLTAAAADEKAATLELSFLSVKHGQGAVGAPVKLNDVAGAVGKAVTFTLDKDNKVTAVSGADAVAKGDQFLTEEYLRCHLEDFVRAVPGKPLGKNDTWTGECEYSIGDGVVMKRSDRGTVTGSEDGCVKLEVESDNSMFSDGKGRQPFVMDLKGEKGRRTILFDAKAGRVRKLTEDYTVAGSINLGGGGGGGGVQALQLSVGMKATISVSDIEPKEKK